MAEDQATSRFRLVKTSAQELLDIEKATPKATSYKNQRTLNVFCEWQEKRDVKWPSFEFAGMFNTNETGLEFPIVSTPIENFTGLRLNFLLFKVVQEVANKSGGRDPSRPLYGLVCGLKRHLASEHGVAALNL